MPNEANNKSPGQPPVKKSEFTTDKHQSNSGKRQPTEPTEKSDMHSKDALQSSQRDPAKTKSTAK